MWDLIVSVPDHCFPFYYEKDQIYFSTFTYKYVSRCTHDMYIYLEKVLIVIN